jgi:hypothetical protein
VSQHSGAVSQHSGLCLNTVAPRLDRTALPARLQRYSDEARAWVSTQWICVSTQWRRVSTGSPYPRGYNDTPTAAFRPDTATARGLTM